MVKDEVIKDDAQQKALPDVMNGDAECSSGPEAHAGTDKSEWLAVAQAIALIRDIQAEADRRVGDALDMAQEAEDRLRNARGCAERRRRTIERLRADLAGRENNQAVPVPAPVVGVINYFDSAVPDFYRDGDGEPRWMEDIPDVRPVHDRENSPFVIRILREEGMSVCLDRVTGHDDLRYQGVSWRELSEQTRTRGTSPPPERVVCVSEDGVYWTVTEGLPAVCRARFQYDREGCLPVLQGVSLTTLKVDTVMEEACAELAGLLNNPSFPVFGSVTAVRERTGSIQDGPGWRLDTYRPEVNVQLYGDTTGRLPEEVTCHHVRDVFRLLSVLNDADRDIRAARRTASSRSWWSGLTGRTTE
ncbi:hypothetical protein [Salmonella enterica]|uniref:hypothetical protein n=1 Tax=Salmonella enterica TaxID=28901 RepID=UPI0012F30DA3|nr:hypothetical protein [Salmonella enterica]EBQ9004599.1 hypothetical protein [Salmonella enterica subsp. enterica serovar Blockley]ECW2125640.1 hypothetical protein [Salmonella enterica]